MLLLLISKFNYSYSASDCRYPGSGSVICTSSRWASSRTPTTSGSSRCTPRAATSGHWGLPRRSLAIPARTSVKCQPNRKFHKPFGSALWVSLGATGTGPLHFVGVGSLVTCQSYFASSGAGYCNKIPNRIPNANDRITFRERCEALLKGFKGRICILTDTM